MYSFLRILGSEIDNSLDNEFDSFGETELFNDVSFSALIRNKVSSRS